MTMVKATITLTALLTVAVFSAACGGLKENPKMPRRWAGGVYGPPGRGGGR